MTLPELQKNLKAGTVGLNELMNFLVRQLGSRDCGHYGRQDARLKRRGWSHALHVAIRQTCGRSVGAGIASNSALTYQLAFS